MKAWERKLAPSGFILAGALFLFVAFKPTLANQPMDAAFFVIGIVFLILGFVTFRKVAHKTGPPNA